MENKDKQKLEQKREFYNSLKEIGLEPKMDKELQKEKDEKQVRENMQKVLKNHEDKKQKVLKAEKTNTNNKKEGFNRTEIIINHLKSIFK
jgi:hypothetical protein